MKHEIGNRTYIVADVEPLDVDGVRTVEVGSALWLIGFVALLPFYGELQDNGRVWWLWTCLAGFGLGLFGLEYCRRRRKARAERDSTLPRCRLRPAADPVAAGRGVGPGVRRALRAARRGRGRHRRRGPAGRRARATRSAHPRRRFRHGSGGGSAAAARSRGRRHGTRPDAAGAVARDVPRPGGAAVRGAGPRPRRARPLRPRRRRRQRDGLPRRGHRAGGPDPAARPARAGRPRAGRLPPRPR